MAKLAPIFNDAQFINAIPANGAKLFTYAAGSSTKLATYTDEDGLVAQSNPIILNSRGEPAQPIWLLEGLKYKFVFAPSTDTDPPVSPIRTIDDISGINDTSITIDQWIDSGLSPTYVSATSFTVAGDQTSLFTNKRRLKSLVTAGTAYSTVLSATFTTLTTVVVVNDTIPLDTGLSNVQIGLLTPNNSSIPSVVESYRATVAATATTTPLWASTAQIQDWTGTPTITNLPAAPRAGVWRVVYPAAGTIFTDNANLDVMGDANYTVEAGDKVYIEALTTTTFKIFIDKKDGQVLVDQKVPDKIQPITAGVSANAMTLTLNPTTLDFRATTPGNSTISTISNTTDISTVISAGSTGGTVSGVASRLTVVAINNAGTMELAWINNASTVNLDESVTINTIAEGGAGGADSAGVFYSNTARTNVAFRVVGYVESTQATAGTWASAPSKIQGNGGNSRNLSSLGFASYYQSADQTITSGGSLTLAHGLGRTPVFVQSYLKCTNAALGYSIGDITPCAIDGIEATGRGQSIVLDSTNINVRISNVAAAFTIIRKDTGAAATITNTDWTIFYRAWA